MFGDNFKNFLVRLRFRKARIVRLSDRCAELEHDLFVIHTGQVDYV